MLADDDVLWAGTTKTCNRQDTVELVREIADAAAHEMRKHGLIPAAR